jgi:16S rRNA U1498 N3-methylase RsmE
MSEKHIFALHIHKLPAPHMLHADKPLILSDPDIWHRITNVLHLREGEECIIFDNEIKLHITLLSSPKKGIIAGTINSVETITPIKPKLSLFLGILKREAFNDALYLAAQMGATSITPLITQKVQRTWGQAKEIASKAVCYPGP